AACGRRTGPLLEAVREASGGRYLEVAPRDGAAKLVMAAVGDGYSLYGNGWKSVAVGGLFEDMPDYEYGCWAAQAYREAVRTARAFFGGRCAPLRSPRGAGGARLRARNPADRQGRAPAAALRRDAAADRQASRQRRGRRSWRCPAIAGAAPLT